MPLKTWVLVPTFTSEVPLPLRFPEKAAVVGAVLPRVRVVSEVLPASTKARACQARQGGAPEAGGELQVRGVGG